MSFGRHTGPLCAFTDQARKAGVAWVNASGNNGDGNFYTAKYVDADNDGNHDVLPGEPKLLFKLGSNATVQIYFDWDDYEEAKVNLDLFLFREDKGFFKQVTSSAKNHNGFTGTSELVYMTKQPAGVYALVIAQAKNSALADGVGVRILNKSTKSTPLSVHNKNNNVYDPASCDGVLAVGALRFGLYETGPLETYSSYGPLVDGRQKPEIVAPTGVSTSHGWFYGTSAACPHAAGALALYAAATPGTALEMVGALIDDAEPMGVEDPDEAYGHGRVRINAERLGWQCDAAELLGMPSACTSTCESIGQRGCSSTCSWGKCVPPWEACNGVDDDCDGLTDEEPQCSVAPRQDAQNGPDGVSASDTVVNGGALHPADSVGSVAADTTTQGAADTGGCQAGPSTPALPLSLLVLIALSVPIALRWRGSGVFRCRPSSTRRCRST